MILTKEKDCARERLIPQAVTDLGNGLETLSKKLDAVNDRLSSVLANVPSPLLNDAKDEPRRDCELANLLYGFVSTVNNACAQIDNMLDRLET